MNRGTPAVLITGALGGIGVHLCDVLARDGYKVIAVDRKAAPSDFQYAFVKYDISTLHTDHNAFGSFQRQVNELVDDHPLCGIVNNAAVQVVRNTAELEWDDWERTFGTNVFAPFFLVRAFLSQLRENTGSVVNMASIHARLTKRDFTAYSTSKGALISLTRAMALDLAPDVRVNAIMPAATDTPMLREGFEGNPDGYEMLGRFHPLGRIARPEEIADVAVFLMSPKSSFMTGSTVWVDGGIGGVLSDPVFAR